MYDVLSTQCCCCNAHIEFSSEMRGRKVKCPACGTIQVIPLDLEKSGPRFDLPHGQSFPDPGKIRKKSSDIRKHWWQFWKWRSSQTGKANTEPEALKKEIRDLTEIGANATHEIGIQTSMVYRLRKDDAISSNEKEIHIENNTKVCAVCGALAEVNTIECSRCGRGVFKTKKTHRENMVSDLIYSADTVSNSSNTERISVLRALREQNSSLARACIRIGQNIQERDEHGNFPLHYAAALGYTDLIEDLVGRGADIESKNYKGQTPLVYAMSYGQIGASKVLWDYQSKRFDLSDSFSNIVVELCAIGVNRTLSPEEADSGFFQEGKGLQNYHHPRVREIGHEAFSAGGLSLMQQAAEAVSDILGGRAAHELSACWNGVGTWLH